MDNFDKADIAVMSAGFETGFMLESIHGHIIVCAQPCIAADGLTVFMFYPTNGKLIKRFVSHSFNEPAAIAVADYWANRGATK